MQGTFCIYPKKVKTIAGEYPELYNELNKYIGQLEEVRGALKGSYGNVKSVIKSIEQTEKENVKSLKQMETALRNITGHYTNAEKVISGGTQHTLSAAKDTNQSTYNVPNGTEEVVSKYKETGDKSILLEGLAAIIGGFGPIGSQIASPIGAIADYMKGEGIDANTIGWVASRFTLDTTINIFRFGFEASEGGWNSTLMSAFGISDIANSANNSFAGVIKGDYFDFSSVAKGAGSVANWADALLSGVDNYLDNKEEQKENNMSDGRVAAETMMETALDITASAGTKVAASMIATSAFGASITAGLAGAGVAAGVAVAAPAVIATVAIGGVAFVVDKLIEHSTGKDISEHIVDGLCDVGEGIAKWFKK